MIRIEAAIVRGEGEKKQNEQEDERKKEMTALGDEQVRVLCRRACSYGWLNLCLVLLEASNPD